MKLRPDTVDQNVFREVITENCYRVGDLTKQDVVIDCGAHIGLFSKLCADKGAGTILAFELEPENFAIAQENLADYPQVQLFNRAVWTTKGFVSHSGMYRTADNSLLNTGSSHVIMPQGCHTTTGDIESVTLDEIMAPFDFIKLIKLDCEGAEFEIVPATKSWWKVERLVGEVHGYRREYHVPDFFMALKKQFPHIEVNMYCPEFGLMNFFAWRD